MPALTLKDVVLHPAFEHYILNTSAEEVDRMRYIVSVHDNWRRVTDYVTRQRLTVKVRGSDGFEHYKECVWSDPNCKSGPDTCDCSYVSGECYDIVRLMNKLVENEDSASEAKTENKGRGGGL